MSQKQLALLLTFLILLTLIIKTLHPAISFTQDLGRHLKLGEIILQERTVPKTNLFTYTNRDFPFINHHWLSEIIFFLLYSASGINTLIILKVILLTLSFALALLVAKRLASPEEAGQSSWATTAITAVFFLPIFLERTHIRPEIFSFLLFSLFLHLLLPREKKSPSKDQGDKFSQSPPARLTAWLASQLSIFRSNQTVGDKKISVALVLIPFLLLLWVNLHIYFATGLALVTFFVLEKIIRKEHIKQHLLLLVACYAIIIFNPNGLAGALEPLQIFKTYGYSIVENQTPFFLEKTLGTPSVLPFKISLLLTAVALVSSFRQKQIFAFLSLSFFTFLALKQIRNFPLYALTAIPFVSQSLHPYLTKSLNFLERLRHLEDPERGRGAERGRRGASPEFNRRVASRAVEGSPLSLFIILLALLYQSYTVVTALTRTPPALGLPPHLNESFEFFKNQKLTGPIFNNFNLAGLAIYHLYPDELLFVDNRPEAFPPEFFQEVYIPMQQDPSVFALVDTQYHFNTIIFQHIDITPWAEKFVSSITQNPDWAVIYLDERTMILVKKTTAPVDQMITAQNALTKLSPLLNTNDRGTLRNLLHFFVKANWPEAASYTEQRLRFVNP
ncbi:MAG: hypothetical protein HYS86_05350 [Candidatus Chisholmbacteria bacterium]|nr:hypothetical protein [Candidatus Chisholmbacteria bacterium]